MHTWESHPDFGDLTKAYVKITEVVSTVNKQRGDSEKKNRVLQIISQIEGFNTMVNLLRLSFLSVLLLG